jgi:hypothetical protein
LEIGGLRECWRAQILNLEVFLSWEEWPNGSRGWKPPFIVSERNLLVGGVRGPEESDKPL